MPVSWCGRSWSVISLPRCRSKGSFLPHLRWKPSFAIWMPAPAQSVLPTVCSSCCATGNNGSPGISVRCWRLRSILSPGSGCCWCSRRATLPIPPTAILSGRSTLRATKSSPRCWSPIRPRLFCDMFSPLSLQRRGLLLTNFVKRLDFFLKNSRIVVTASFQERR